MGSGRNPMDRLIDAMGQLSVTFRTEMGAMQDTFRTELRSEIGSLRDEFRTELRSEIGTLRTELTSRLDRIDTRLDHVLISTGDHWRDLERRVGDLEKKDRNGT